MSTKTTKRRSRILSIQKKNLVCLVENFFIRSNGHCSNVNFSDINIDNWRRIASVLNTMGPPKTFDQWKNSFYFMRNRILRKVRIVLQYGGHPRDNLCDLDFRIYDMSPIGDYELGDVFTDPAHDDTNANFIDEILEAERRERTDAGEDADVLDENTNNESNEITEEHRDVDDSPTILVSGTAEYLEEMTEPLIVQQTSSEGIDDSDHPNATDSRGLRTHGPTETFSSDTDMDTIAEEESHASFARSNKPVEAAKSVRIPEVQKERLVQLIQNNFMKVVGRFAGVNGKGIKSQVWNTIAKELNTLGPPRTAEQWKLTFNSIKAGAKSKLADNHNVAENMQPKSLTRLEEKIVSIYGMDSLDGHQSLGESGFRYAETIPQMNHTEKSSTRDYTRDGEFEDDVLSDLIEEIQNDSNDTEPNIASEPLAHSEDFEQEVLRELIEEIRNEFSETEENVAHGTSAIVSSRPESFGHSRLGRVSSRSERDHTSRPATVTSRSLSGNNLRSESFGNSQLERVSSRSERGVISRPETVTSRSLSGNALRSESFGHSQLERVSSRSERGVISRPETVTSRSLSGNALRSESFGHSQLERVSSRSERGVISRPETVTSRSLSGNALRSESFGHSQLERVSSRSERGVISRPATVTSRSLSGNALRSESFGHSQLERVSSRSVRGPISPSISGNTSRVNDRQNSSFAPPRARKRKRSPSPIEYITNINQFFNDHDDDDGSDQESRNSTKSHKDSAKKPRDRSDLRNRHTSHEMVQHSISAQERFIEDSNRNHAEMLYLSNRNHSDMVGMFTSTLGALERVAINYLNRN